MFFRRPVQSYCDVGCADGFITVAIGNYLHLSPTQIFGCDVRDLPPEGNKFQFKYYDGQKLPYMNNSFDLMTIYMVMHHIPHIQSFIKELYRVLKNGGYLVIREHDCNPEDMRMFLDIQHGLYALVLSPIVETPDFCTTFQTYYKSRTQWREMLCNAGFTEITSDSISEENRRDFNRLTSGRIGATRPNGEIANLLNTYYGVFVKQAEKRGYEQASRDLEGSKRRNYDNGNDSRRDREYGGDFRRDRQYGGEFRKDREYRYDSRRDREYRNDSRRDREYRNDSRRDREYRNDSRRDREYRNDSRRDRDR